MEVLDFPRGVRHGVSSISRVRFTFPDVATLRLAASVGGNTTAKRVGILKSTVANRVRRSKAGMLGETDATPVKRPVPDLGAEKVRLPRELASAKLDLEVERKLQHIPRRSRGETRLDRRAWQR